MFEFEDEYTVIYGGEFAKMYGDWEEETFYDYNEALKYAEKLKETHSDLTVYIKETTFSEI